MCIGGRNPMDVATCTSCVRTDDFCYSCTSTSCLASAGRYAGIAFGIAIGPLFLSVILFFGPYYIGLRTSLGE